MPQDFKAVRYHSQAAVAVPDALEVTAWCDEPQGRVVMGVAHRERPLHGVQFHPESILTEHGARARRELPSDGAVTAPTGDAVPWVDPEDFVVAHLTGKDRAFWLDGTGARPWSGRFSYVGWLGPDDVSLAYDATAQTVTAYHGDTSEVVGDDVFAVLTDRLARSGQGDGDAHRDIGPGWVGWLGYASRPDLPARLDKSADVPEACWLRAERMVVFDHASRTVSGIGRRRLAGRGGRAGRGDSDSSRRTTRRTAARSWPRSTPAATPRPSCGSSPSCAAATPTRPT